MAEWFVHVTTRSSFRSVTPRGGYFPGSSAVGGLMRRSDLGVGDPNEESRSGASPRLVCGQPTHTLLARALHVGG